METIDLYKAIAAMRELSREGKTFNMIHATLNRDTGQGNGQRRVRRARLRPAAKGDDVTHAGFKIFYYDLDEQLPRVCWQPLLMYFNGMKVILN